MGVILLGGAGLDHAFLVWGAFARRPAEAIGELGEPVHAALTTRPEPGRLGHPSGDLSA